MKKSYVLASILAGGWALLTGCATSPGPDSSRHVVTQVCTYDSLYHGLYDGVMPLDELKPYGDFGLGTIDGFNGEVVLLDGKFTVIPGDGHPRPITDLSVAAPFFELTHFSGDIRKGLPAGVTYAQMQKTPLDYVPSENIIYAVKLTGLFQHVKTRSMPKQSKPYPPLGVLVKTQPTFEFTNVVGTMVGFWTPPSMKGVALAGWHLHFLTADGQGGGHVLAFTTQDTVIKMDECHEWHWLIPNSDAFRQTDFTAP